MVPMLARTVLHCVAAAFAIALPATLLHAALPGDAGPPPGEAESLADAEELRGPAAVARAAA